MSAKLKSIVRTAFHRSGALGVVRHLNRHGARILTYHRFAKVPDDADPKALLEAQCAHIRECYNPVSLTELGRRVRAGVSFPVKAIAVTVDDGYRDFHEIAYPVFSAYRIPVTVYLVTDFLDCKTWLWVDQLDWALRHARTPVLEIECPPGRRSRFTLGTEAERSRASSTLKAALKTVQNHERLDILNALPRLLDTTIPPGPPEADAPLTWEQVRTMMRGGVEFGAHTKTHPILSRLGSKAELRDEIEGSKLRIEQETGAPVSHFCYPNGRPEDFEADAIEIVERARFQTAVTMQPGLNSRGENPFLLKRIGVEPALPELLFREYAAGFRIESGQVR